MFLNKQTKTQRYLLMKYRFRKRYDDEETNIRRGDCMPT